ncbi:uncharacterized protein LOC143279927 [Babylonia areolata]|uniref:uncharacterized protein LOC143279927 n=1 Tax=Babylonia areolata TaxID=304850 RepID=UPI003FD69A25
MASAFEDTGGVDDVMYTDDAQLSLEAFIRVHNIPQAVSVTGGSFMSRDATITRGDVLLLRSKAPASVTLSFAEKKTGVKQELTVNPDIPVQFLALPPKGSIEADQGSARGGGGRPMSMITYPTVADLLMDCPTYFEANSTFDDPYLPGFSVKPGDRFYFVKVVKDVAGDKAKRLQCRTESGELVCLSTKCKGNFTVVKDDTPYTLRQLIDLAKVPRRLLLAPQQEDSSQGSMDATVLDKLGSCSGVITMLRPQEMLEVSPWDSSETTWFVPQDSSLKVRLFSDSEYEEPVTNRRVRPEPISTFAHEHEDELPVQATLLSYFKPSDTIAHNLSSSRAMIIHEKLRTQKLFVKDSKKDEFFAIDESVDISFVQIPRAFSSVFEMMSLPLGSQVRVLADVAADFPEPFILRYGDVLCVTKHDSFSWKFKHSSTGDVPIVKCERLVPGKKPEKLKLPLDLELDLVLIENPSQLKVTKVSDIISGTEETPGGDVSVLEGNGASYPPLPVSLQLLEVLTDIELLVSPLSSSTAISPLIQTAIRIPVRHKVVLGLKRKLEFPDGYFVMPPKHDVVSLGIERVEESEYEELAQARKVATDYEDMVIVPRRESEDDARSLASSSGRSRHAVNQEFIPSSSSGTLERRRRKDRIKRFSQALNPKNWHWSRGGKETGEEEENIPQPPPAPPVSGILTLSLEPSHAVANQYVQEEFAAQDSASLDDGSEVPVDDTYEDVEVVRTTERTQSEASDSDPVVGAACSDYPHSDGERQEDVSESRAKVYCHQRRKTDPGIKMLVQAIRPQKPSSPEHWRKSPEHRGTDAELERAPPIRHTRTRSPDFAEKQEGRRLSPQSGKEVSYSAAPHGSVTETKFRYHKGSAPLDVRKPEKQRETHSPKKSALDKSSKPRSPELDHSRSRPPPPVPPSRAHGRGERASPALTVPESPGIQLPEVPSERRDEERKKREQRSISAERLLDQPQTRRRGETLSPQAEKKMMHLQSELSIGRLQSPRGEKKLADQRVPSPQPAPRQARTAGAEDSPQRPRRPRRKIDGRDNNSANGSTDSLDDGNSNSSTQPGTPETAPKGRGRVKPAVPPKPTLGPRSEGSEAGDSCKPLKPHPVAPPRRRAARIGSTEAETFGGGSSGKPVLGRKRLS